MAFAYHKKWSAIPLLVLFLLVFHAPAKAENAKDALPKSNPSISADASQPIGAGAQNSSSTQQPKPGAYDERVTYDEAKCSRDPRGMVYVAVGKKVFRQPKENLIYIHGNSPEEMAALPHPLKPLEPEGCPDHPMRGFGFTFSHISPLNPDGTLGPQPVAIGGGLNSPMIRPVISMELIR